MHARERRELGRVLLVASLGLGLACGKKAPPPPPPPPEVLVAPAEKKDVVLTSEYVGALDGYVNVEIRARVPGFLQSQDYTEGSVVKAGQLLFTIDPRDYQARVSEAKAALARAQANLAIAEVTVRRLRPLADQRAVSQQDLDDAVANQRSMKAAVDSARAKLERADLDLSYTRVTSPLTGLAGTAQVRIGNLVGQGIPTLLTTVSDVEPIRANFSVTERDYLAFRNQKRAGPAGQIPVRLILSDGSVYPFEGQLLFAERQVNPKTGTLAVTALFPNPKNLLRPGQAGRIRLGFEERKGAVLVPQRAVNEMEGLFQVAVVSPDGVAHVVPVKVGPSYGNQFVIESGLKGGEQVVTEGFAKAKDGAKVAAKPAPAGAGAPAAAADQGVGAGGTGGGR
jgi:membrane fusion protein (multidrug efflux system)